MQKINNILLTNFVIFTIYMKIFQKTVMQPRQPVANFHM